MNNHSFRPIAFVVASTNHGSMLVNRHDYRMTDQGGYGVGYQLLQTSSFDQGEINAALMLLDSRRKNFGQGVVAIDCGANIGVHTIEWAKHMANWGSLIAFEAQERIFYALAGNIAMNNCFNARAIWAAVGASSGVIGVPIPNYFTPSSFGSLEIRRRKTTEFIGQEISCAEDRLQPTSLIALDDYGLKRVDFIKIDIEGMEMEALAGAEKTIHRAKPQLMIEKIKSDETGLQQWLESRGYKVFPFGLNLLAIHQSDPACTQINVDKP